MRAYLHALVRPGARLTVADDAVVALNALKSKAAPRAVQVLVTVMVTVQVQGPVGPPVLALLVLQGSPGDRGAARLRRAPTGRLQLLPPLRRLPPPATPPAQGRAST